MSEKTKVEVIHDHSSSTKEDIICYHDDIPVIHDKTVLEYLEESKEKKK